MMLRILLLTIALPFALFAQIPSPESFLGYASGENFSYHHQVTDYLDLLGQESDRVKVVPYGESYEGRTLQLAVLSSPENLKELENLRQAHLGSLGREENSGAAQKVVVWLGYNIHGDEAASTEAALRTLHYLSTSTEQQVRDWLDACIILIDPCMNPDGRERYVQEFRQWQSVRQNTDIQSAEHQAAFPWGRYNHYLFDLNRDWLWQTQQESRQRAVFYQKWMPHVLVDFHEMGIHASYFFPPSVEPIHKVVTDWQKAFQQKVAQGHAHYFNQKGWRYYTNRVFDLFYPSYGDTWSSFQGAIGMTYEQAGSRLAGTAVERKNGQVLTLKDRIEHHFTSGLSTLKTVYENRRELKKSLQDYFNTGWTDRFDGYRTYIVRHNNPRDKLKRLQELLDGQGISYGHPKATERLVNGFSYRQGRTQTIRLHPEDMLISVRQTQGRMVQVLFEPEAQLNDSLTYDITAWALPYSFGLEAFASKEELELQSPFSLEETSTPHEAAYAYLIPWESAGSIRTLGSLLLEGWQVRAAGKPFQLEGKTWAAGTLVLVRGEQSAPRQTHFGDSLRAYIGDTPAVAVNTGLAESGIDLGANEFSLLEAPSVGLVLGDGIQASRAGELWHFFEERLDYPISLLRIERLNDFNLGRYDVLLLPSGNYKSCQKKLEQYLRYGGRLVVMGEALEGFTQNPDYQLERVEVPTLSGSFGETQRTKLSQQTPGSIVRLRLDNTHPLAFGYGETYFSLKHESALYQGASPDETKYWNVGTFDQSRPVSGFMGYRMQQHLSGKLALGVREVGKGQLICFADTPVFRGFWCAGELFIGNAVFMIGNF